jgi:Asp-tRNA(Asn)/Glu-tRNA(Gln) amidotransferase A subunit family amidase
MPLVSGEELVMSSSITIAGRYMGVTPPKLTARQLAQGYLDRINAYDKQGPNINAIITINPNALAEADRLDAAFLRSRDYHWRADSRCSGLRIIAARA